MSNLLRLIVSNYTDICTVLNCLGHLNSFLRPSAFPLHCVFPSYKNTLLQIDNEIWVLE